MGNIILNIKGLQKCILNELREYITGREGFGLEVIEEEMKQIVNRICDEQIELRLNFFRGKQKSNTLDLNEVIMAGECIGKVREEALAGVESLCRDIRRRREDNRDNAHFREIETFFEKRDPKFINRDPDRPDSPHVLR